MPDYTWQGIPSEPTPTSCPGGVCGSSPPSGPGNVGLVPGTGYSTPWTVNQEGGYGGQKTLGDYYREQYLRMQQAREQQLMYESMLRQYSGPESTWIRLLIRDRMSHLRDMRYNLLSDYDYRQASEGINPPPIPSWMQPYISTQTTPMQFPEVEGRKPRGRWAEGKTTTTTTLRPLSPTAKLSAEQQNLMAGWLAWQEAGAPTKFSEDILPLVSDIERYWTPYRMESQAMFPQPPRKPQWATATQK